MAIAFVSHDDCVLHDVGPQHPECPQRLRAIAAHLGGHARYATLHHVDAPLATREQLEAAHHEGYVEQVFALDATDQVLWLDGDTGFTAHTLQAARRAAGAAVIAVDLVMGGETRAAFCAVRPPGHHAEHARAMGFCVFNNVAVGAYHALNQHGLERVAILDFDVHHGNGTEHIVAGDERVLFCSTFEHPLYPYSGHDSKAANVVNVPLAGRASGDVFREAVRTHWLARLRAFAPQLILVSAGFDAHQADALASLQLLEDDYVWVTREICAQAARSAQGRVVSLLEGGYALGALAQSVGGHLDELMAGDAAPAD